jgi:hypothetical protein
MFGYLGHGWHPRHRICSMVPIFEPCVIKNGASQVSFDGKTGDDTYLDVQRVDLPRYLSQ